MAGIPKVALLIETARGFGRGPWAFYVTPGDFEQALPEMKHWGGTGVIARIETPQVAEAILATGLPVIALDLSEEQLAAGSPLANLCEVSSESFDAARMAAEHLLERGFRHYAFVGVA